MQRYVLSCLDSRLAACIVVGMTGYGRTVTAPGTQVPASPAVAVDRLAIELETAYRWASGLCRDRSVVDVGCGSGYGASVLARHAKSVVGVGWDPQEVETAAQRHGDRVRFALGSPGALELPAGGFDAATCFGPLERASDPEPLLTELKRVLAPGGLLIASLPIGEGRSEEPASPPPTPGPPGMIQRPDTSVPSASQWQSILEGQFRNVDLRGRRVGIAVAIHAGGSSEPVDESIEDAAWVAGEPAESRVALALASDSDLPDPPALAVLTGLSELNVFLEKLSMWEQRARRAEAEGSAKHWELVAAREAQRRLRRRLHQLEHRPLRVLSRVVRGKPARLGPGPKLRLSELPKDWN
jgi:SAM-dependent methyltransferase